MFCHELISYIVPLEKKILENLFHLANAHKVKSSIKSIFWTVMNMPLKGVHQTYSGVSSQAKTLKTLNIFGQEGLNWGGPKMT